jgi:hypothetical protein
MSTGKLSPRHMLAENYFYVFREVDGMRKGERVQQLNENMLLYTHQTHTCIFLEDNNSSPAKILNQ